LPLFSVDLKQLARIRAFVSERAQSLGVSAEAVDSLCLAVDEVVTNIVVHGYEGPGTVSVDLEADGKDLLIRISDEAPAFDPTSRLKNEQPNLGERTRPGGLGIFLVGQSMDEVAYARVGDRNQLTLAKRNVIEP
jgi:serine/threonine-protein kinase RsbW